MSNFRKIFPDNNNHWSRHGTDDNDFRRLFIKYAAGANYNRIQQHLNDDCICFITAYSPFYDTRDKQRNISICKQENEKLENKIAVGFGYSFIKVKGHYKYTVHNKETNTDESFPFDEESFIVISNTFIDAVEEGNESLMLKEGSEFKEKMIELRDMFKQEAILIRYYKGNGEFATEMKYSAKAKASGHNDVILSNKMTEQEIKDYWTTHKHTRFILDEGTDSSQIKLASLEFDYTFERWHPIDSMVRAYNWERYLHSRKNRKK
ncbi:MAG: hypothetical protein J5706_01320 [Elusimicrobiales bacterium]|nr:hypothetical protein [Elusimicrobiales bacterium]